MENFFGSIFSGVSQVVGKLLGHPLDFLSGKSCNTNCKPTWDFICYIENFCVSLLLKSAMVIVLCYFVLLFLYLQYKLGICQCICHTVCRSIRACFGMCFSMVECCCNHCCSKLHNHNQRRRRKRKLRDIEATTTNYSEEGEDEDEDYEKAGVSQQEKGSAVGFRHRSRRFRSRRRDRFKDESLKRGLRVRSHRVHAGVVSNDSVYLHKKSLGRNGDRVDDHVRVSRSSKFARKRASFKASVVHHRRRR